MRFLNDRVSGLAFAIMFALTAASMQPAFSTEVFASGIPTFLGKNPNWDAIFSQLASSGIKIFLPDSQYVQLPEAKSLGWEVDFLPPRASKANAVFTAMRKHSVKLMVPAECLYPRGTEIPDIAADPLRKLIDDVGRESIGGVFSYDEPVTTEVSFEQVQQLYRRVKEIDPSLPVYLVHAPIPEPPWKGENDVGRIAGGYLPEVKRFSALADVVGFDIYPIPENIAKVYVPSNPASPVSNYRVAVGDYSLWLRKNLPEKKHFMVLQAFSYEDQGFPKWVAQLYRARRPTAEELNQMALTARQNGIGSIGWWGQGMLGQKESDRLFWQSVLNTSRLIAALAR